MKAETEHGVYLGKKRGVREGPKEEKVRVRLVS